MARSKSRLLVLGYVLLVSMIVLGSTNPAAAQFDDTFVYDTKLAIKLVINDVPITHAADENFPIPIDLESPMQLYLQINNTHDQTLNMSGVIWFYYNGIAIFPVEVRNPDTNATWVEVPPAANVSLPPIEAELDLGAILSFAIGDFDMNLITGKIEASLIFSYAELGSSEFTDLSAHFYILVVSEGLGPLTSVVGAVTVVSTVGAVYGLGNSFYGLFDGIQAARKVRSIQKKMGEIRSLPNLTVLGATPALFAIFAGMTKMKRKEPVSEEEEAPDAITEYRLRQRLREVAPEAWPMDKCPQCKRNWHKQTNTCKKCKIDEEHARAAYAEYLLTKVPRAIRALGKKKSLSVQKLAKKTKSTPYNAGVMGAAMVDIGLTEITKIETPIRGFVMNIAGLAFLVLTWQQLFGAAASHWQTTLTVVGGALSFAVIIALYFARRSQLEKYKETEDAADLFGVASSEPPTTPTEDYDDTSEDFVEDAGSPDIDEESEPRTEDTPMDAGVLIKEDVATDYEEDSGTEDSPMDDSDVGAEDSTLDDDETDSDEGDSLTPEELDRERM